MYQWNVCENCGLNVTRTTGGYECANCGYKSPQNVTTTASNISMPIRKGVICPHCHQEITKV